MLEPRWNAAYLVTFSSLIARLHLQSCIDELFLSKNQLSGSFATEIGGLVSLCECIHLLWDYCMCTMTHLLPLARNIEKQNWLSLKTTLSEWFLPKLGEWHGSVSPLVCLCFFLITSFHSHGFVISKVFMDFDNLSLTGALPTELGNLSNLGTCLLLSYYKRYMTSAHL